MSTKKIACWNIRHGGGSRERQVRVIETLLRLHADLLVVTEFRANAAGTSMQLSLEAEGYHVSHPAAEPSKNSVMLASRSIILRAGPLNSVLPEDRHLWSVELDWLSLCGVYMPLNEVKIPYWDAVISSMTTADSPALFIGDFNTGRNDLDKDPRGERYIGSEHMDRVTAAGFIDLWRSRFPNQREYSWYSPQGRNGFRLDHAFASSDVAARVVDCRYVHEARESRVSDHSVLVLELAIGETE